VQVAIELDDKSHEGENRAATDRKNDNATAAAGVKLVRWHARSLPDEPAIQATIALPTPQPAAV
jgi:very-short-patch-repair endonuclease